MKHIILSSIVLFSCIGSKAQTTQSRDIKPFTKLEVSGAANVQFTQGDTLKLKVVADESELNNVYTTHEDGTLTIRGKGNFKGGYKIYVTGKTLNQITAAGASRVNVTGTLETDSLVIDASGASDVTASIYLDLIFEIRWKKLKRVKDSISLQDP